MRTRSLPSLLLPVGLLCVTGVALAASSWTEFREIHTPLPCMDGWAGCLVAGQRVDPGGVRDAAGRPHPASARVGFFDLRPLPAFDPFPALSPFAAPPNGSEPIASNEIPPEPVEPGQPEEIPAEPGNDGGDQALATNNTAPSSDPRINPDKDEPIPGGTTSLNPTSTNRPPPNNGSNTTANTTSTPVATTNGGRPSTVPPLVPANGSTTTTTAGGNTSAASNPGANPANPTITNPSGSGDAVAMATPTRTPPPTTSAADNTCDDLVALEAPAMMGTLGAGKRKCLEARLASESSQTMKKKVSLVLLQDAETRQDQGEWERIIQRHLQDIDRSDPNLCFKYAIHLARGGRHSSVIKWADYALENKQQWSGATYTKNVYALYKLRAQAANSLWEGAEKKFVEERNDENEAAATRWRDTTKNYAREWLDYARASAQATKVPLALCVSAAGSVDFCEG